MTVHHNPQTIANDLILQAAKAITQDRPNTHGDAALNFECISDFQNLYDKWLTRMGRTSDAADAAQKMVLFKIARTLTGDRAHHDHYVDEIGYTALAGRLAGAAVPAQTPVEPLSRFIPSVDGKRPVMARSIEDQIAEAAIKMAPLGSSVRSAITANTP